MYLSSPGIHPSRDGTYLSVDRTYLSVRVQTAERLGLKG